MTYNDLIRQIDQIKADNTQYYGDFGFDFAIDWDGNTVADIFVTWPAVGKTSVLAAFHFGEALQSFCFDGNRLIGTTVED